jgi:hypothetical protein
MHFGLLHAEDSGKELTTFDEMNQWKTLKKRTWRRNWSSCSRKTFGKKNDWMEELDFQCWCERKPKNVPSLCAEYGGDCLCNGLVF